MFTAASFAGENSRQPKKYSITVNEDHLNLGLEEAICFSLIFSIAILLFGPICHIKSDFNLLHATQVNPHLSMFKILATQSRKSDQNYTPTPPWDGAKSVIWIAESLYKSDRIYRQSTFLYILSLVYQHSGRYIIISHRTDLCKWFSSIFEHGSFPS